MIIHESEKVSIHPPVHGMIVKLYDEFHIQVYFDQKINNLNCFYPEDAISLLPNGILL